MWIIVAIVSYFLFAIVALLDKYLLSGPIPNPKTYVFCVGVLGGGVAVVLSLLRVVVIPPAPILLLGLIAGVMRAFFLLAVFSAFRKFEASRVVPAFGGALPLFTFLFTFLVARDKEILLATNFLAFLFLLAGTVAISYTKDRSLTLQSLLYALAGALFGAASSFFSKFAYEAQPFLSGLSWLLFGVFFTSLLFLASGEVRREVINIFQKRKETAPTPKQKFPLWLFLGNQVAGGSAVLLQNLAVALVPFGLLPLVSAMGGIEYFSLFLLTLIFLRYFPSFIKEEISREAVIQKLGAMILISIGLVLLAL